ncbi:MAG: winged helix-turn-helix domain-containing protein [Candidatus Micrarchaeia archaeon]
MANQAVEGNEDLSISIFIKSPGIILATLIQEEKWTVSDLSRKTGLSFVYVMDELKRLERLGLLTTHKEKKFRYVMLTQKGIKVAESIKSLTSIIMEGNFDSEDNLKKDKLKEEKSLNSDEKLQ